jgi:DNA-binding response OmpR family regulator
MSKDKILIMDSDDTRRNLIETYLIEQGYDVTGVPDGTSGLKAVSDNILPNLVIVELTLPDMDSYEVIKQLRTTPRTNQIPLMFLTKRIQRPDRIGESVFDPDDYITIPFDPEEMKIRIQNLIKAAQLCQTHDRISCRPKEPTILEHLRKIKHDDSEWVYLDIIIQNFVAFSEIYGWQARDNVVETMSLMLGDIVDDIGTQDDFIGHPQWDSFVMITHTDDTATFKQSLIDRFNTEIQQHYSFLDRERGYIQDGDKRFPLMLLAITEIPHTNFGEQWDGVLPKQGGGDEQR